MVAHDQADWGEGNRGHGEADAERPIVSLSDGANNTPVVWINADHPSKLVGTAFGAKITEFPESVCTTE